MRRLFFMSLVVLLFIGVMVPQPAVADHHSETRTIYAENYYFFPITYKGSGTLSVTASVDSYYGSYFDVYYLTPTEFTDYKAQRAFSYISACSDEDTSYADIYCTVDAGTYYLVFDNMWFSGAQPYDGESITVTLDISTTDSGGGGGNGGEVDPFFGSVMCIGLGVVILVIVIIVAVVAMRRRRTASGAPMQQTAYHPPVGPPAPPPGQQTGYVGAPPPQAYHQPQPQYSPPPQEVYEPPPPQPQPQPQYQSPYDAPPPPPDLELPGMMGGTRGTLDETYKGKRKDPYQ